MMQHLDLFSGIGGFALGLQRTGKVKTIGFCDFDKKTHPVLQKNFPGVSIYDDVRTLKGEQIGTVDIVTGGFPCQDLSLAGKGAGLAGERSGLWFEMHRIIKETKPKYVIAENVSALRSRGLDQVLRSLAEIGYDAEWHCIPASAVGAPHRRDRIWIVAHPNDRGSPVWRNRQLPSAEEITTIGDHIRGRKKEFITGQWRQGEPRPYGVANGVPNRVDRIKQLGNALVPQIVTLIGNALVEAEQK